jgi:hypothetical protein
MLLSLKGMLRKKLTTTDDEFGRLTDQYIDDRDWVVRYFVADTGTWLPGRLVLISPVAVRSIEPEGDSLVVELTREQIEKSPSIEEAKPVSRRMEEELTLYYDWPRYWTGAGASGVATSGTIAGTKRTRGAESTMATHDPTLRSASEITGYHIDALDGEVGHVEDLLADEDGWSIRYLVVDTRNWLPGKKVLLLPGLIDDVDWTERKVSVDVGRETIESAPELVPDRPLTRADEERLLSHYGVPLYWTCFEADARRSRGVGCRG